jgi:hypothetical protein
MQTRSCFLALALALVMCAGPAWAQPKPSANAIPSSKELLKGFTAIRGLNTIHRKGHKAYLEVSSSQMKRPFLLATTISGGPTYAGFQWGERVAAWERIDKQLVLFEREVRYRAKNPRKPMARSVRRTYTDRVLYAAPIVALNGSNPVVDLGALFGGQAETFFGDVAAGLDGSLVMISKLKCFPKNIVIELTLPDSNREGRLTTLSYSLSSLPQPGSDRYRPRKADDRVGYFLTAVKDFTDERATGDRFLRFVNRWSVAKADASLAKSPVKKPIIFYIERSVPYRFRQAVTDGILEWNKAFAKVGLLGALVVRQQSDTEFADLDPEDVRYNFFRWIVSERAFAMGPSRVNPRTGQILDADIIFDESMVRSYLRRYELKLRKAPRKFFSPQIQKMLDSDPRRFAFASSAEEPEAFPLLRENRTSCSLGTGVAHQVTLGLLAARMRGGGDAFPQEFMDQIVKDVVMHEVGHTLGLRHNFKASTFRSLDEINSDDRPDDVCGSVMDYNPVNIQFKEGGKQGNWTMRTIGPYDHWAIRYAYDPNESKARQETVAAVTSAQYAYATDEDVGGPDPYAARWDLGRDPLQYAEGRMKLAKSLWPQVVDRVVKKGEDYKDARRALQTLLFDYQNAGMIATRFIGGQRVNRFHRGDVGAAEPLVPIPASKQRAALNMVCEKVFKPGNFALSPQLLRALGRENWRHWGMRAGPHSFPYYDTVLNVQSWVLYGLINPETLTRMIDTESKIDATDDLLTVPELFSSVSEAVFGNLIVAKSLSGIGTARKPLVSTVQRNLQRHYVSELIAMTIEDESGLTPSAIRNLVRLESRMILARLVEVLGREQASPDQLHLDPYTRGHLEAMISRLTQALNAKYRIGQ